MSKSFATQVANALRPTFKTRGFKKRGNVYRRDAGGYFDEFIFKQSRFDSELSGIGFQVEVRRSEDDPQCLFTTADNWLAGHGIKQMLEAFSDAEECRGLSRPELVQVAVDWYTPLVERALDLLDEMRSKEGRAELRPPSTPTAPRHPRNRPSTAG